MSEQRFIGRGEYTVGEILKKLFGSNMVFPQRPFSSIVSLEEYDFYDTEVQKHKFDFVVTRPYLPDLVIEVNYKHKEKASKKWRKIFEGVIRGRGMIPVTIEERECRHLFKDTRHPIDLRDWNEVICELIRNEVEI